MRIGVPAELGDGVGGIIFAKVLASAAGFFEPSRDAPEHFPPCFLR
jgi:hypothetical protein